MKTNTLLWLLLVLTGFPIISLAQKQDLHDKDEILYYKYQGQNILESLQKAVNANAQDIKDFSIYYQDTLVNDQNKFIVSVTPYITDTDKFLATYISNIQRKYISLFNTFKRIKKEFPSSVDEAIKRSHAPSLPACNATPCDNIDFSSGNLSGWTACYMQNTSTTTVFSTTVPTCAALGAVTTGDNDPTITGKHPAASNQVYLQNGAGTDPISGLPKVCPLPGAGKYSVMLGDSTICGSQMALLENTFPVTPATCNFTYYYAVVFENPLGHTIPQQPFFSVTMFDQNGDTIPHCGTYNVASSQAQSQGFDSTTYQGNVVYYSQWVSAFVALQKYIGQCVSVVLEVSDCAPGGHYGYAYFAAVCNPLKIITSAPAVCGNPITLTAPPGAAAYSWTGPCISGPTNTQTITITCGGKYVVVLQNVVGQSCADTLDTIVPGGVGTPPVPFFKSDTVCAGAATQFTNLTTGGSAANSYLWTFQGGSTSTATNPTYTFPAAGTYTTSLQALNGTCGGDTTLSVVVTSISTAGFKANTVCLNNPTVFTDTSKGATNWSWNFGEPSSGAKNTSTLQNPTHTYATAGTFTVTQVTGTPPCTDTAKGTVVVNPLPAAKFTFTAACFGQATNFTDASTIASGTDTSWSWNFGDPGSGANNTSTVQNPTHTFSAPGTYSVILTVTSNFGCQSTITIPVVVSAVPVAAFSTNPVCQGQPTVFNNTSSVSSGTITGWKWTFGDGTTSNVQHPTHVYPSAGGFVASLTVTTSSGCTDSTKDSVIVYPVPVAKFTATTVCQGYTTTFTDGSTIGGGGTIASWSWNFGDGGTSTLPSPTHLYKSFGVYNVSLTVTSDKGCDSTYHLNVIVNPIPKPAFVATQPCFGAATIFTNNSTVAGGTIDTTIWLFGDGTGVITTFDTTSHIYPAAGTDTVEMYVISNQGCVDSIAQPVIINPIPVPAFFSDTTGCTKLCVTDTDKSMVANINKSTVNKWLWNFGDGSSDSASTLQDPSHCYTKPGAYTVQLTITTNHGCTATLVKPNYVTAWPVPVACFTANPTTLQTLTDSTVYFTDCSGGNPVKWFWSTFGDQCDSIDSTQNTVHTYQSGCTHSYQDTGTYCTKLTVTNKYGCKDSIINCIHIGPMWTFYVPNAFTPNSDGLNDGFIPKAVGLVTFDMWIFDRWGQLLYHCNSLNLPWDGKVHIGPTSGQECPEDTYVWLVEFTDIFRNSHREVGRVTLIK